MMCVTCDVRGVCVCVMRLCVWEGVMCVMSVTGHVCDEFNM